MSLEDGSGPSADIVIGDVECSGSFNVVTKLNWPYKPGL